MNALGSDLFAVVAAAAAALQPTAKVVVVEVEAKLKTRKVGKKLRLSVQNEITRISCFEHAEKDQLLEFLHNYDVLLCVRMHRQLQCAFRLLSAWCVVLSAVLSQTWYIGCTSQCHLEQRCRRALLGQGYTQMLLQMPYTEQLH